ncbi:MAG TPA: nitroreductase family protein [Pyrinomonadaceae bacterium]|jgi:nitroreductase|nr:nitroreductase family protein [Pyrinomonadaceae bacterium]
MIKGTENRNTEHPIDELFLNRWSPRAMTGEAISQAELLTLFEAARWAPSSYNYQPWRFLYAHRDSKHWLTFFNLLVEFNQSWAQNAAALVVFISRTHFDFNGQSAPTHSFDTGAAWENLALQGCLKGLVVHGMQGFDYERARTALNIPEGFQMEAMCAIGRPAHPNTLSESLLAKEVPSERRKLEETICEGPFCF